MRENRCAEHGIVCILRGLQGGNEALLRLLRILHVKEFDASDKQAGFRYRRSKRTAGRFRNGTDEHDSEFRVSSHGIMQLTRRDRPVHVPVSGCDRDVVGRY